MSLLCEHESQVQQAPSSLRTTGPTDSPLAPGQPDPRARAPLHQGALQALSWVPTHPHPSWTQQAGPSFLLLHTSLLLSPGRRCGSVMTAFSGDPLGALWAPPALPAMSVQWKHGLAAVGNCDPLSTAAACVPVQRLVSPRHCQEGFYGNALAPRPADKCMREYQPPRPTGAGAGQAPSADPAGCSAELLCSLGQVTHLLSCPVEKVRFVSSPRFFRLRDLISSDPVIFFVCGFPAQMM